MKRTKHGLFGFPPKKTPTWRRYCSIGQTCCSMTLKRSIGWYRQSSSGHEVFSPESSLNRPKATRVCIRLINQSKRSISVYLLFLFCLRVFISRSYENRSITLQPSFGLFVVEWALHKDKKYIYWMLQYDENLATEPQPLSLFTVATWLNPLILKRYIKILPDWTPKHFLKGFNLENLIKDESIFSVMNILLINILVTYCCQEKIDVGQHWDLTKGLINLAKICGT